MNEYFENKLGELKRVGEEEAFWLIVDVEKKYRNAYKTAEKQTPPDLETERKDILGIINFYIEALKITPYGKTREEIITSFCAWETLADYKKFEYPFVLLTDLRPDKLNKKK